MKKIVVLLFIFSFLIGGYASARYISPEPNREPTWIEETLLKLGINIMPERVYKYKHTKQYALNGFENVNNVYIVFDHIGKPADYGQISSDDKYAELFPDYLKESVLKEKLKAYIDAVSLGNKNVFLLNDKAELFLNQNYKKVMNDKAVLIVVAVWWSSSPDFHSVVPIEDQGWDIRLDVNFFRHGQYNTPHIAFSHYGKEIKFPKCDKCNSQEGQINDFFIRVAGRFADPEYSFHR